MKMKINPSNQKKDEQTKELRLNKNEDWQLMQSNWMKERKEKIEAYADRYFMTDDELPLHKHVLLVTIFFFFIVAIIWASFATLDIASRGDGQVVPSSEIQEISNLEGGIVDEFFVKEGDKVKKDQTIMRLRDVGATSELGSNEARYLGLLATITRLQAEVDGKQIVDFPPEVIAKAPQSVAEEMNAFSANRMKLSGQTMVLETELSQRRQEVSELQSKASDLQAVIRLSEQELEQIRPLVERGSAPRIELLQLDRALKEKQTELNSVRNSIPRANSAISQVQARIGELRSTLVAQSQMELAAKTIEMNAIKQTLGALQDRKGRTEIKSPVDGIIKDLKVNTVGGVVKPGEPFIEIVPMDDQLIVEAKIKPSDIARLRPGMPAIVKFTAYDFAIYGGLKGKVTEISADTIKNEKGESFYRVKVRTDQNILKHNGEVLPIIPGMVASIDILTGERTVMQYLLKPITKTLENSMNEK
jgi:adhesin transport system membrane fusion protein